MRFLILPFLLWAQLTWGASPSQKIEELSSQVAPLWQSIRPVCVMGVNRSLQQALQERLNFMDERLVASNLIGYFSNQSSMPKNQAWSSPVWQLQDQLERDALNPEEREELREYFFKLQTQTPNKERSKLVADVQYMSEELNMALREQIWKTCHALGFSQMTNEQMETLVDERWQGQFKKVKKQMHDELAAFYFYSFRTVQNKELAVIARVSSELKPWVESTKASMQNYFRGLRAELLIEPINLPSPSTDEPFPVARPWNPEPSQGRL
jgi:hypothetical protein